MTLRDRRHPLRRRTGLARGSELARGEGLARVTPLRPSRGGVSPATPEQKAKVDGLECVAAGGSDGPCMGPVDPMHLIDRSLAPAAGEDVRMVVPGCRRHHNLYDDHMLDLSPYLEPRWREEAAFAVAAFGLFPTVNRITGHRWVPA